MRWIFDSEQLTLTALANAHFDLGRAYALQVDFGKARATYGLFPLWKNADPDIPILKQAKAEYVKLQ